MRKKEEHHLKAALSQINSYDIIFLSQNQLILASMPSLQSNKITHNRTDLNCLEKVPKISLKVLLTLLAIKQISVSKYEKMWSDRLSAVLYHWFSDVYANIASFQDKK